MLEIVLRNRQRAARVDARLLRRIVRSLLENNLDVTSGALGVHLVEDRRMTELNEKHLRHGGTTDVITFNYLDGNDQGTSVAGDVFICVPEALRQASRFRDPWQSELVRYIVHGILHLRGYDDQTPAARRKMKREETRLLKDLSGRFRVRGVGRAIGSLRG